jgi:hypothetical protein
MTSHLLTNLDDYPWHQAVAPLPIPATSDSHFNDGYYFGFFDELAFVYFGMRLYPNNNVIDGYAGAVVAGEQRTTRASRVLRPDVERLEVGPLRLEIVEPMRTQRLVVEVTDSAVAFDVMITAVDEPFFESPEINYRHGRLFNHVLRYTQLGRATGVLNLGGEPIPVENWASARDHSWGIRASMGPHVPIHGVGAETNPRAFRFWMPFDLPTQRGFVCFHDDTSGKRVDCEGWLRADDGAHVTIADVTHEFSYAGSTTRLESGRLTLRDADGGVHEYEFDVVSGPATPQAYGYVRGWCDGQSPGNWRGDLSVEGDRFRVDDWTTTPGPSHVPVERRMAPCEYAARLRGPRGESCIAQIEHMIYGEYQPYGFEKRR